MPFNLEWSCILINMLQDMQMCFIKGRKKYFTLPLLKIIIFDTLNKELFSFFLAWQCMLTCSTCLHAHSDFRLVNFCKEIQTFTSLMHYKCSENERTHPNSCCCCYSYIGVGIQWTAYAWKGFLVGWAMCFKEKCFNEMLKCPFSKRKCFLCSVHALYCCSFLLLMLLHYCC